MTHDVLLVKERGGSSLGRLAGQPATLLFSYTSNASFSGFLISTLRLNAALISQLFNSQQLFDNFIPKCFCISGVKKKKFRIFFGRKGIFTFGFYFHLNSICHFNKTSCETICLKLQICCIFSEELLVPLYFFKRIKLPVIADEMIFMSLDRASCEFRN